VAALDHLDIRQVLEKTVELTPAVVVAVVQDHQQAVVDMGASAVRE
jgi:hypothetical protein